MYVANGFLVHNCHHTVATSYRKVLEGLQAVYPSLRHVGVTATPMRADGEGLAQVYDREVAHYGIKEMVGGGWLVPPRWLAIQTGISLAQVAISKGDYVGKQLADVFETANCFELVVESHKKYADGRQCLAFVQSVDGAYRLAETFREAGVVAEAADGTTPKDERAGILRRFRSGKTQVLCNVALWTEGLDVPQVSCIHQVRPTKSDGLYLQMIGRGLRPVPGKDDCIAEGQRVLTDYGLVPIERVTTAMLVWDGVEFVRHSGAFCRGEQEVMTYAGLTATPDHKVWTDQGWLRFETCAKRRAAIRVTERDGRAIREALGYQRRSALAQATFLSADAMCDMWGGRLEGLEKSQARNCGLPKMWAARRSRTRGVDSSQVVVSPSAGCGTAVHQSKRCELRTIRCAGHRVSFRLGSGYGQMDSGQLGIGTTEGDRSDRQRRALRGGQPAMGVTCAECCEQPQVESDLDVSPIPSGAPRDQICRCHATEVVFGGPDDGADHRTVSSTVVQAKRRVWDILNAGPRHRFTVEGLLVSNCLILDYAPLESRNIVMMGDVLGSPIRKELTVRDDAEPGEVVGGFTFDGTFNWLMGDVNEIISRKLDYLEMSPWSWHREGGWLSLGLGSASDGVERTMIVSPADDDGVCTLYGVFKRETDRYLSYRVLMRGYWEEVADHTEGLIAKYADPILASREKRWRRQPVTEAQLRFERWYGVQLGGLDRGEASKVITHARAMRVLQREGLA